LSSSPPPPPPATPFFSGFQASFKNQIGLQPNEYGRRQLSI
jgi:hypothetical protein